MARPIKETPILTGTDAENFVRRMKETEGLSKEVRQANKEKLMEAYEQAKKRITNII
jgi:hypothetical protein